MSQQDILENILKRLGRLESQATGLQAQLPLFTILNVNEPAQITANQNNYDPGDYDLLHINTDASRTITGFTGGVEGRVLIIHLIGTNNVVLANLSASSDVGNRIVTQSGANLTITPRNAVFMVYRDTQWRILFSS